MYSKRNQAYPPRPCASWRVEHSTELTIPPVPRSRGGFTLPLPPPYLLGPASCWRAGGGCPSPGASKTAQDAPKTLPRRPGRVFSQEQSMKNMSKFCFFTTIQKSIDLFICFFLLRNSGISHLCATLDLRFHSGYLARCPAGYPWRLSMNNSHLIVSMDTIHG